jgi:hypothetical protein
MGLHGGLLTPGYWQSTYFPGYYWDEDYWPSGDLIPGVNREKIDLFSYIRKIKNLCSEL